MSRDKSKAQLDGPHVLAELILLVNKMHAFRPGSENAVAMEVLADTARNFLGPASGEETKEPE